MGTHPFATHRSVSVHSGVGGPAFLLEPRGRMINAQQRPVKSIVAAFVIAAMPVCVQAQPTPVTKADAQNVFKIIRDDKAKTQTFCDMGKLGDQMEEANARNDSKKVEELSLKADEMGKQLGTEFNALMDGIQDVDPESEVGLEIKSLIQELNKLCAK
jgi:hypothetical protein